MNGLIALRPIGTLVSLSVGSAKPEPLPPTGSKEALSSAACPMWD